MGKSINDIKTAINKAHTGALVSLTDEALNVERIPTGVLALDSILSGGFAVGQWVELYGNPGGGKGLTLDTPLPTPTGWTYMEDVAVGDLVLGPDGQETVVLFVSEIHNRPCYRVSFSDGSSLIADDEHQWHIYTAFDRATQRTRSSEWRENRRLNRKEVGNPGSRSARTATLEPSDGRTVSTLELWDLVATEETKVATKVAEGFEFAEQDLWVDPYVLGCWLGDGTSSNGNFTTTDPEVVQAFAEDGWEPHRSGWSEITYATYGLMSELRSLNMLNNKHVPMSYLRASKDQRLALLQGLMDSDGCSCASGAVEFTSTNYALASGVQQLFISLGVRASIQTGQRATLYGKDCGEKFRVKVTAPFPCFRLQRKLERQNMEPTTRTGWRYVTSVEPVDGVPTKCIQVDNESRCYLAGENWVTTHNTSIAMSFIGEAQKRGTAVLIDLEGAFDPHVAENSGVDTDALLFSQPDTAEATFQIMEEICEADDVSTIVVDSVAGLTPKAELEGDYGDSHVGLVARLLSQAMRKMGTEFIRRRQSPIIIIWVNQVRDKIGSMGYGPQSESTGGRALKFWCSTRLSVARTGSVKKGEEVIGQSVKVQSIKHRSGRPYQNANFDILYDTGISNESTLLDLAVAADIVMQGGAWYTFKTSGEKVQGRANALEVIRADDALYNVLMEAVAQP